MWIVIVIIGAICTAIGLFTIPYGFHLKSNGKKNRVWIIVGVLCGTTAIITIPYAFYLKSSGESEVGSTHTIQVNQSVKGNKIVVGDYIEGDKIEIYQGISEKELNKIVAKTLEVSKAYLCKQYPDGVIVFGISEKGIIVPRGQFSDILEVDWETAKILKVTPESIHLSIPKIYHKKRYVVIESGIETILMKKSGYRCSPIAFKGEGEIVFEVIGVYDGFLVVGMGYKKI